MELATLFFFILRGKEKHVAIITMHHDGESDISSLTNGPHEWSSEKILSPTLQEQAVRLDSTKSSHQGRERCAPCGRDTNMGK
jgi:hypothetical protein